MPLLLYWIRCDCTIWPVTPLYGLRKCGACDTIPHTVMDEPTTGKATRL